MASRISQASGACAEEEDSEARLPEGNVKVLRLQRRGVRLQRAIQLLLPLLSNEAAERAELPRFLLFPPMEFQSRRSATPGRA